MCKEDFSDINQLEHHEIREGHIIQPHPFYMYKRKLETEDDCYIPIKRMRIVEKFRDDVSGGDTFIVRI